MKGQLSEKVIALIRENFDLFKETSKDIQIKCPYCGGSTRHRRKPTLYISKYPIKGTFVFHCFRASCGVKGTLFQFLSDFGLLKYLEPNETTSYILPTTKPVANSRSTQHNLDSIVKEESVLDPVKERYILSRLRLTKLPSFVKRTVITDLSQIVLYSVYDISERLKQYLVSNFVGFRSYHKYFVICRNIDAKSDFRYFMLRLSNGIDYYCTSPQMNQLMCTQPGYIVLAEGVFSLLSGYFRLLESKLLNESSQVLLCSTNGAKVTRYKSAYEFCVYTFGIPDWDVIILSDSDVRPEHYIGLFNKKISVCYNRKGNDFADYPCEVEVYHV